MANSTNQHWRGVQLVAHAGATVFAVMFHPANMIKNAAGDTLELMKMMQNAKCDICVVLVVW